MKPRAAVPHTSVVVAAFCLTLATTAAAQPPFAPSTPPTTFAPTGSGPADSAGRMTAARDSMDVHALALGRAAYELRAGNMRGVVESLEGLAFWPEPAFAEADRAAFLLAHAYLELGSRTRFLELARTVSRWQKRSVFTEWLAYERRLAETLEADALAPSGGELVLTPSGSDSVPSQPVLSQPAPSFRPESFGLSTSDTTTALGRDLKGAELLDRAAQALARGEDPRPLLAAVPAKSRFASRARHLHGVYSLEKGALEEGRRTLEALLLEDSTYVGRRQVELALAGQAIDQGNFGPAYDAYGSIDLGWTRAHDGLEALLARGEFDTLWTQWRADPSLSDALTLDARPVHARAATLAASSANLTARPSLELPVLDAPARATGAAWPVAPPTREDERLVRASETRVAESAHELERTRWAALKEAGELESRRRYLDFGRSEVGHAMAVLGVHAAMLDSLGGTHEAILARLRAVKEEAIRRLAERTASILEQCTADSVWLGALRRFHIEGPNRERAVPPPAGYPDPDSLTLTEADLTQAIRTAAEKMAADGPGLIERSHDKAWGPSLADRVLTLGAGYKDALAFSQRLAGSIDSSLARAGTSETLDSLAVRAMHLTQVTDSLARAHQELRARIAREAVNRALAELETEREAIDYGLAAASYGASVEPGRGDSTLEAAEGPESPEDAMWRVRAIGRLEGFLARHPESFARGEMRFRLADLLVVKARQDFREAMARFEQAAAQGQGQGSGLNLPLADYGPALALYRSILAQDSSFAHQDAVLFNAGMIQLDAGEPEAQRFFEDLVTRYPASSYAQNAHLRLGDLLFADRQYAECVARYREAAAGSDSSLKLIALYKMGWAHYNEDHFLEAADAFRLVLDLYESSAGASLSVDVESEAEAYMIHALAQAGGAPAFQKYFDGIGKRPYEMRLLLAMGQHFRRFSLLAEAAAADRLCIQRFPLAPEALTSAERLTDTHRRANQAALERESLTEFAPHFAPGSAWAQAQTSDSVRTAGSTFSRTSWRSLALHHHNEARQSGSSEEWKNALTLDRMLIEKWPNDPDAPLFELQAGEASTRLGEYKQALDHYANAAKTDRDSVARVALWQRVAVTDTWYETTRKASKPGADALGSDALAKDVLDAADAYLTRYPADSTSADVMWRQGNLAFAHGWFERAAGDLEKLSTRHPGDTRAPVAASLRADALFRLERYDAAGAAFEAALVSARAAGRDSLAKRAAQAIPVCYYRHAESAVKADSSAYAKYAPLFEKVAERWPDYELAHVAQYRAALAYLKAERRDEGVRAMRVLISRFPKSEYVKDAYLQIASTWEAGGDHEKAGRAYADFSARYPDDENADEGILKAADHFAAGGLESEADTLRLSYLEKYPEDVEAGATILEAFARREVSKIGPGRPISTLLPAPSTPAAKPGKKGSAKGKAQTSSKENAAKQKKETASGSYLARYLKHVERHPEYASRPLIAQVRFLEGEESRARYDGARLSQPLKESIPIKKALLDSTLARYRRAVDVGEPEWAHAAGYRIGETLVAFGDALVKSERPAGLAGDDLLAYDEVLRKESQPFFDRGEQVWADVLKQNDKEAPADTWITQAQNSLWKRLGERFYFRPELEYPVLPGKGPENKKVSKEKEAPAPGKSKTAQRGDYAQGQGGER